MKRASVWFYETSKQTFRHIFTSPNVIVIPGSLLRLSLWDGPPGVDPRVHHRLLTNVMADTHGMLEKGWAVLQETVDELQSQLGIGKGSPYRFSDFDIHDKMVEKRKQKSSISFEQREAYSRWIIKLAPFKNYTEQFGSERSLCLPRLMRENVVFELTEFSRSIQSHIISALELWTLAYKQQNPEAARITNVRIIDEAMNLVAEDKITLSKSFVFKTGIRLGRQYRQVYVLGEQDAQSLAGVLGLAQAVVIMQQSDFALPFFYRNMLMTRGEPNHLKNIPIGRGVVATPERPLTEITIPFHEVPHHRSDEEIEKEMEPIIEEFLIQTPRARYESTTVTHTEQDLWHEKKVEIPVTPDEMEKWKQYIKHIARYPDTGVAETFKAIEVDKEPGYRIVRSLKKQRYIEGPQDVSFGRRPKKIYAPTYEGCRFAGLDWEKVRLRGKGGLASKLYARIIHECLKKRGGAPEYEYSLKAGPLRKQCDVADLNDANPIAYEFENTLNSHVITNIEKNDAVGFSKTIVVCKNQEEKKKTEDYLAKNLSSRYWSSVDIQTIKEFL